MSASEQTNTELGVRIRACFRYPPDSHHRLCDSRKGGGCDCYGYGSNAAHTALNELLERTEAAYNQGRDDGEAPGALSLLERAERAEANRDQWHSAANEASERADALTEELRANGYSEKDCERAIQLRCGFTIASAARTEAE